MPSTWIARYCAFIARRASVVMVAALAVLLGATLLAKRLELRTAFSELLPSDDPGVVALAKTQERMGDMSLLLIGIRSPDKSANLKYAEALTQRLNALPASVVAMARYHVRDIRGFFEEHKWLYLSTAALEDIRDRLRREITKKKNPFLIDIADDQESIDDLKKRIAGENHLSNRFPDGVFGSKDGRYVWIAALPPGGLFTEGAGEALFKAAHQLIQTTNPRDFQADMEVEVTGPVATAIANRQAVERDIMWVTLVCLALVALAIGLYFRRVRVIPLVGIPAVIGTVMAFAVAELAFGYLNSSTAFLGSIILGNGINYAIIFMSRYQEERAEDRPFAAALELAFAGVVRGTAVAAVCASGAYAALGITSFRGFLQFGVMGAVGVLFCWLATFTVLPALLALMDRRTRSQRVQLAPVSLAALGKLLHRRTTLLLVVSTALTLVSVPGLVYFLAAPFEYDFRKLRARLEVTEEAREFDDNQEQLFGRWPSPTIILADKLDEVEDIRAAIRKQDTDAPGGDVIGDVVTIYDLLPGVPGVQREKRNIIAQIRKLVRDPALEVLTPAERADIKGIDPPGEARELVPGDLPPLARRPFTEVDGTVGRVVLVYAGKVSVWKGQNLLRIAGVLQKIHLAKENKTIETSGSAVVFGSMIRSILHDGPRATSAALVIVMLIILLIIRPLRAGLVTIGTLMLGVVWMVGAAGAAEVKVTFLNFIALPITFGIGAEYALNVVTRYQQGKSMLRAVISTGSAVALCSLTTIVGYGSLLAARNQALQGFGAMAVLGEISCLAAALIALPALVLLRRRAQHEGSKT